MGKPPLKSGLPRPDICPFCNCVIDFGEERRVPKLGLVHAHCWKDHLDNKDKARAKADEAAREIFGES